MSQASATPRPCPGHRAIDRGDNGLFQLADLQDERVVGLLEMFAVGDVLSLGGQHFGDVVPGAEGVARPRQHHAADLRVRCGVLSAFATRDHLEVEGVGTFGAVEADRQRSSLERSQKRGHVPILPA